MTPTFDATFWDNRYGTASDYVFGTAPNDFLAAVAAQIPPGPVLCVAEGEGRNAVFLARRGHAVTAVDQSAVGLAKAQALAAQHGVALTTVVADLSVYPITPAAWSGIIVIFVHLPPALRASVLAQTVAGLAPGGLLVLECYSPAQLAFKHRRPARRDAAPDARRPTPRVNRTRPRARSGNRTRRARRRRPHRSQRRRASPRAPSGVIFVAPTDTKRRVAPAAFDDQLRRREAILATSSAVSTCAA